VLRVDRIAVPLGASSETRGAAAVARGALAWSARARFTQPALVNGAVGVVVAPGGRLVGAGILTIQRGRITVIDLVADPERLRDLELAILDD
jgi:RNA polymerase sigma-70 factor (ECF subfamily)